MSGNSRILYIEDDLGLAKLLQIALRKKGFDVETCASGDKGLEMLRTGDFDLAILDQNLPGMEGVDILREMGRWESRPPAIMLTGQGSEGLAVEAMKLGADDYMVKDVDGRYRELLPAVITRILEHGHMKRRLAETERSFRQAMQAAPIPLLMHASDGEVLFANEVWRRATGLEPGQLDNVSRWRRDHCEEEAAIPGHRGVGQSTAGDTYMGAYSLSDAKGKQRIWDFYSARIGRDAEGRGLELIMCVDITERVLLERELRKLATRDGLTGISNRRMFDELYSVEWRRAKRESRPLALLLMDVDHFKNYNDTYGHAGGDICLRKVARAIERSLHRPSDFAARYGGEEFVAVLPNTDRQGAEFVGARILESTASLGLEHASSPVADVVTVSIGLAVKEVGATLSPGDLLEEADRNLYRAKAEGRNCLKGS